MMTLRLISYNYLFDLLFTIKYDFLKNYLERASSDSWEIE